MLKQLIRLTRPGVFMSYFLQEPWPDKGVIVRPTYLSICAADQRYFQGQRPEEVLQAKLPMALLHEAVGEVLYDPAGIYVPGDKVVLVPCVASSGPEHIATNYLEGGHFHSSNCDGFTQEMLILPHTQLVKVNEADEKLYVFSELLSVCVQVVRRWQKVTTKGLRDAVGIWGDGAFSYILALALKAMEPEIRIIIFGKHDEKLAFFSFADDVVNVASKCSTRIQHGFECVGGGGSEYAIRDIINRIYPQGLIFLLGVSEVDPPVHTRLVLEKGLTVVGSSRSSYSDFVMAVELVRRPWIQGNLRKIISKEVAVYGSEDLEQAFRNDTALPFKTVLRWAI